MSERPSVPDLLVERLALGELPPEQAAEVRARLAAAGDDRPAAREGARLAALRRSDETILAEHPPRVVAAAIHERLRSGAPRRPTPWMALVALPVATAAAILLLVSPADPAAPAADVLRAKGDARLMVYRQGQSGPAALTDGDLVRPGDVLQLGYLAAGTAHGVIVSVDGRGEATLHYPLDADQPTTLEGGGVRLLPFAYELDDAPAFERFYLITAQGPIDASAVLEAARAAAAQGERLDADPGLSTYELTLRKGVRP